jgi:hypothetical protein
MTRSRKVPKIALLSGAALAALALSALPAEQARAEDCLLDRDNDGVVDAGTDNDGGADSGGLNSRLACGVNATASGANSTAIGASSTDVSRLCWCC